MAKKYLRGIQYTTGTNGRDIPIFMKFCYEFWGYCVNPLPIQQVTAATNTTPIQITTLAPHGLSSNQIVGIYGVLGNTAANGQWTVTVVNTTQYTLNTSVGNGTYTGGGLVTQPGGMPITPTSGPAGFFEGAASVLAVGIDGVTSDVGINFTSLSGGFTASLIGKHITIWSGTDVDSTDNSIYRIMSVPASTQLMLAPFSGGTPDVSTLKNNLTSRSALNYRIIDVVAASQLAVASGNYFVGTLSGASAINTGQASSQFQFLLRGSSQPFGQFGMIGSPNGSWNGSAFVSAAGTSSATLTERLPAATNFTGTTSNIQGYVTIIADKDFFIGHVKSPNSNAASGPGLYFYTIIPQRFYTLAQDPNPLVMMVGGNNLLNSVATDSQTNNFAMVGFDGTTRLSQLMTRNFVGDGVTGTTYTVGPNLSGVLSIQGRLGRAVYSEAILSSINTAGQYSLARAKMRPIVFCSTIFPSFHLIGDNGEFIHVGNGTLWPWDGSILPYSLLPLGT